MDLVTENPVKEHAVALNDVQVHRTARRDSFPGASEVALELARGSVGAALQDLGAVRKLENATCQEIVQAWTHSHELEAILCPETR